MGIEWHYEMEGYDLGGMWYLPDFWLPKFKTWAEVKPEEFDEDQLEKCELLTMGTNHDCLLLVGPPTYTEYQVVVPTYDYIDGDPDKSRPTGTTYSQMSLISRWFRENRFASCYIQPPYNKDEFGDDYIAAVRKSRQFRFERTSR